MYQESVEEVHHRITICATDRPQKRLYKAYMRYRILYVLQTDPKEAVKSIYTSQSDKLTHQMNEN